jgi:hypothetical protein
MMSRNDKKTGNMSTSILGYVTAIRTHPSQGNKAVFLINFLPAINPESLILSSIIVFMLGVFGVHKDRYIFLHDKDNRTKDRQDLDSSK